MKILSYVSKHSSPAYHRIILPLSLMEDVEVRITNELHTSHFEDIDIFVYNRIIPEFAIDEINKMREKYGFKICVDIDDYWILDKTHPYRIEYIEQKFAQRQIKHLANADFITVTHERLLNEVLPYVRTKHIIHTLTNAIPQTSQFINVKAIPQPEGLVRLFWQGSNTHLADIAEIRKALVHLSENGYSRFTEMVLAGYEPDQLIWQKIAGLYTAQSNLRHSLLSSANYEQYYYAYQEADICLIPLRKSLFNSMKSNLKVLEAANLKLPVIASKVNPYLDLPIRYASNYKEWLKHIKDLVLNKDKRIDEGEKLYEYCKQHFDFAKINNERKQIYQRYIN